VLALRYKRSENLQPCAKNLFSRILRSPHHLVSIHSSAQPSYLAPIAQVKMGRKGKPLSAAAAEEAAIRKAEKKAKKAAKRAIVRENRAKGIVKPIEGWEARSRRVAKEQGLDLPDPFEDVFGDGKVHAKWGPLFKKHLGLLESHIKA
jgi:hypothetical protein